MTLVLLVDKPRTQDGPGPMARATPAPFASSPPRLARRRIGPLPRKSADRFRPPHHNSEVDGAIASRNRVYVEMRGTRRGTIRWTTDDARR